MILYISYWLIWFIFILNLIILYFIFVLKKELLFNIKNSIEPKFLEIAISPDSNKIILLAIDIWRLEERITNISDIDNSNKEKINNSINRVKKYVGENKITIKWYNWDKYSNEINVYDLKWTEPTTKEEENNIIKDTIEPAVFIDWKIIKKAKIIIYKLNS
jgi:hypothetical protein